MIVDLPYAMITCNREGCKAQPINLQYVITYELIKNQIIFILFNKMKIRWIFDSEESAEQEYIDLTRAYYDDDYDDDVNDNLEEIKHN